MRVSVAAAGLPGRYAAALFDLAETGKALDATAADLSTLKAALAGDDDAAVKTAAKHTNHNAHLSQALRKVRRNTKKLIGAYRDPSR